MKAFYIRHEKHGETLSFTDITEADRASGYSSIPLVGVTHEMAHLINELLPPAPWSFSSQEGTPRHCHQAQVWDKEGKSLACIEPTDDSSVATSIAAFVVAFRNALGKTDG